MRLQRIIGIGLALAVVAIAGVTTAEKSNPKLQIQQANQEAKASSAASSSTKVQTDAKPAYGSASDKTPNQFLAESVLTDSVKNQVGKSIVWNNTGAFIVNNNQTDLDANVTSAPYVQLTDVDDQGRAHMADALLSKSSRQYANRQSTGNAKTIKPGGWQQQKMQNSYGNVLYNRGHSIGYALAGNIKGFDASEANYKNITTQTAWANQASNGDASNTGQNYYESLVRKALDSTPGIRIRYRVTPIYDNDNLVPSGTHIEAKSNDGRLEFNVFVPNVEPGVNINYLTGQATIVNP